MKVNVCVKTIDAYGTHVRFTPQEHLQVLLNDRKARGAQAEPYREWERASRSINWFDGDKPVSLPYVKSHMPRAMLLELRFPVDQNPHMVQADVDRLLEAERIYNESATLAEASDTYLKELMAKYGIGPAAVLDEDMGGATPHPSCEEWEEREWPES